ncbi:hypothetical protein Micbo1qcDRAFT_162655 [Microdochium bolleyi]|uniref:N-acetyltransferase domain-containing protein n=1 Tax=Microdochium bolleyi TaxID=196109 RepID=A0A136J5C3_9PEZI|nr:hypothetical protein Micbo1qcDRAFT_162655 [Microdochium bolleyi]
MAYMVGDDDADGRVQQQQGEEENQQVSTEDVVAYAKWTLPNRGLSEEGRRHFESLRRAMLGTASSSPRTATSGADQRDEDDNGCPATKEFRADHPADLPEGANPAYYKEFYDGLERLGKKWRLDEMLELSLMCTRPEYHGYGIAGAMIRDVLDIADREGIRTVLLGMELAAPLYQRLGFKTVDTAGFELARTEAGEDGVLHVMIREPRAVAKGQP